MNSKKSSLKDMGKIMSILHIILKVKYALKMDEVFQKNVVKD